jgi:hypothetical protein
MKSLCTTSLLFCSTFAFAQDVDKDKYDEPIAIVELGDAGNWNVKGGSSFGADFAAEITPIEHWLELEAGTTLLLTRHSTEWDTEFLFKAVGLVKKSGVHGWLWP